MYVLPLHKAVGKANYYSAIAKDDRKYQSLLNHFEYPKNLSEVQASRIVAFFIDEIVSHKFVKRL